VGVQQKPGANIIGERTFGRFPGTAFGGTLSKEFLMGREKTDLNFSGRDPRRKSVKKKALKMVLWGSVFRWNDFRKEVKCTILE